MEQNYFLTVSWCGGERGIFCNTEGVGFVADEPHTQADMVRILGPFWIVLLPESELFTLDQIAEYTRFRPLEEYTNKFGIALRPEQTN